MNVCARMHMCLCKCVRAANGAGDLARQWGIMGDEILRTLTPSDPAQPKKSWESHCRLADGVEDKFTARQTAGAETREWQRRRNWERLTKRQTETKKTQEQADGMTRMRNTKVSAHIIANKMLNISILVRFTSRPEQAVLFGNKNWAFFAHLIA